LIYNLKIKKNTHLSNAEIVTAEMNWETSILSIELQEPLEIRNKKVEPHHYPVNLTIQKKALL